MESMKVTHIKVSVASLSLGGVCINPVRLKGHTQTDGRLAHEVTAKVKYTEGKVKQYTKASF